jgi:hypothetical protein
VLRVARKSETFKHGEGDAHSRGKHRVVQVLEDYFKYNTGKKGIFKQTTIDEEYLFQTEITVGLMNYYPWPHAYDIMVKMLYTNGLKEIMAIEIDGSTHEKPKQKNNDEIAEWIYELYSRLDQARKRPDFDTYDFVRIGLTDALKAEPHEIIFKIFK